MQARLGQVRVPPDFAVGFGAEVEEQARSFQQLQLVLVLAVLLVYAVMASQYESLRDPFIIMFSIPVAAIGVVGGLLAHRTPPFNMQAYIGVIMLAGIVVSNAILLVDYINTLRRRDGMPLREAVEVGGRTRLRPILMTSIATMLGLVPMAIGARRRRRAAGAARPRRHRRAAGLDDGDAGARAGRLHAVRGRLSGMFHARSQRVALTGVA